MHGDARVYTLSIYTVLSPEHLHFNKVFGFGLAGMNQNQ